jgi:hypothetical protein
MALDSREPSIIELAEKHAPAFADIQRKMEKKRRNRSNLIALVLAIPLYALLRWLLS